MIIMGWFSRQMLGLGVERIPKEVEWAYRKKLEFGLDQLTLLITSLTERLVGKTTGHDIEYEDELMHNAPATG